MGRIKIWVMASAKLWRIFEVRLNCLVVDISDICPSNSVPASSLLLGWDLLFLAKIF